MGESSVSLSRAGLAAVEGLVAVPPVVSAQSQSLLGQPGGRVLVRSCCRSEARRRVASSTPASGTTAASSGLAAAASSSEGLPSHSCHSCLLPAAVLGDGVDSGGGDMGPPSAVGPKLVRSRRQDRQGRVPVLGEDDAQLRRQPLEEKVAENF
jgi:hypothetical protein